VLARALRFVAPFVAGSSMSILSSTTGPLRTETPAGAMADFAVALSIALSTALEICASDTSYGALADVIERSNM